MQFKIAETQLFVCQSARQTTVAGLAAKQSSGWPPFYVTTNSQVACAFWGSDECVPSVLCFSVYF